MENFQIYRDIQARTGGDIYIGVVGPARPGKSTFIRRFMELMALPAMEPDKQAEVRDQLPLSGSGKLITTVEPKFIPKEAVPVTLGEDQKVRIKLIDCVGFLVKDASGHIEEGRERMVRTPWFEKSIPFHEAAQVGTRKVIEEHATIGLVVTTDGSFGEIPRQNFAEAEALTVNELKKQGKPFLILVNSQTPYKEETQKLCRRLWDNYGVTTIAANCEQLRKEDVTRILENILYEFPVSRVEFYMPKWVEMLPFSHPLKTGLIEKIRELTGKIRTIRDVAEHPIVLSSEYVRRCMTERIDLADGCVRVLLDIEERYYYEMLSEYAGEKIENAQELLHTLRVLSGRKQEYDRVASAMEAVHTKGYGVVLPRREEIHLEQPEVIRHGNKFGVKIRAESPSLHFIRATVVTEIAPIVGTEQQAKDLIGYIDETGKQDGIWETNIFGKTVEQLVNDGIRTKISMIGEESQEKLQDTMQKIVNDSTGGMVCIII